MNRRVESFSLLEVVASLALIATAVTMILVSQGRSLEQLRATRNQQLAAVLAEELITQWKIDRHTREDATEGSFEGHPGWYWSRREAPYPFTIKTPLQEVTLSIYHAQTNGDAAMAAAYTWLERDQTSRTTP